MARARPHRPIQAVARCGRTRDQPSAQRLLDPGECLRALATPTRHLQCCCVAPPHHHTALLCAVVATREAWGGPAWKACGRAVHESDCGGGSEPGAYSSIVRPACATGTGTDAGAMPSHKHGKESIPGESLLSRLGAGGLLTTCTQRALCKIAHRTAGFACNHTGTPRCKAPCTGGL